MSHSKWCFDKYCANKKKLFLLLCLHCSVVPNADAIFDPLLYEYCCSYSIFSLSAQVKRRLWRTRYSQSIEQKKKSFSNFHFLSMSSFVFFLCLFCKWRTQCTVTHKKTSVGNWNICKYFIALQSKHFLIFRWWNK